MTTLNHLLTAYAASPTPANRDAIAALFAPAPIQSAEFAVGPVATVIKRGMLATAAVSSRAMSSCAHISPTLGAALLCAAGRV